MRDGMILAAAGAAALLAGQVLAAPSPTTNTAPVGLRSAGLAGPSTVAPRPAMRDSMQIEFLERGFMAAFNAKNVNRIMSYYDRNGLFVFDVVPPRDYPSWASYKKDWEALFAANPGPIEMKLSDLAVTVSGDMAYSHSIQGGYFTDKAGKKNEMAVRVTDVYRRIGNRWLIVHEHVSVPVDFATGKPDMMSKP